MPENPASYRVVRTKSYLFNKAHNIISFYTTIRSVKEKDWCHKYLFMINQRVCDREKDVYF
ncbi:hypothetical protein EH993_26285 [Klebsiella pneumoniae]|nr:hypothetical protein EH993_26285 [Klebsiella pneumoniae]